MGDPQPPPDAPKWGSKVVKRRAVVGGLAATALLGPPIVAAIIRSGEQKSPPSEIPQAVKEKLEVIQGLLDPWVNLKAEDLFGLTVYDQEQFEDSFENVTYPPAKAGQPDTKSIVVAFGFENGNMTKVEDKDRYEKAVISLMFSENLDELESISFYPDSEGKPRTNVDRNNPQAITPMAEEDVEIIESELVNEIPALTKAFKYPPKRFDLFDTKKIVGQKGPISRDGNIVTGIVDNANGKTLKYFISANRRVEFMPFKKAA